MRIGVARWDITPPAGVALAGFIAREGTVTGSRDPLYATALVAEEGDQRVALVTCDLIGLGAATVQRLRAVVERATGIPAVAQMYACTHTHGGPETGVITSTGHADPAYLHQLERHVADAVMEAAMRLVPARLGWARSVCQASHNRVLARAGQDDTPGDAEVLVGRVESLAGQSLAAIVHYTCHPVAAGPESRLVTADWCGVTRQRLEAAGVGPVLVINGAAGDINPRVTERGFAAVERTGTAVADVALTLWQRAEPAVVAGVAAAQTVVPLVMLPLAPAEEIAALWERWLASAREHQPDSLAYRQAAVIYRDHARRLVRHHWGSDPLPRYTGETQALRLGPLAVVSLPGEFFSDYGLQIKAAAPAPATMVSGWTNDNLGYFPTADLFPIGGYEMDTAARYYGFPAPWAPAAGAAVTGKAIELVQRLFS